MQHVLRYTLPTLSIQITDKKSSCNDKSHYSLCIINENCKSTRLLSVKVKQIQSQQLVHITLYDSSVAT